MPCLCSQAQGHDCNQTRLSVLGRIPAASHGLCECSGIDRRLFRGVSAGKHRLQRRAGYLPRPEEAFLGPVRPRSRLCPGKLPARKWYRRRFNDLHGSAGWSPNCPPICGEEGTDQYLREQFYRVPPGERRRDVAGVPGRSPGRTDSKLRDGRLRSVPGLPTHAAGRADRSGCRIHHSLHLGRRPYSQSAALSPRCALQVVGSCRGDYVLQQLLGECRNGSRQRADRGEAQSDCRLGSLSMG